ncbi:MAG: glycosyltransferase [Lachnospiraceae bacterium]|nr:glycosyltransferase [Lachnospiraceae bacterium]
MRLLYWEWHSFLKKGVERAFEELNIEADHFFYQLDMDWEHNEEFKKAFLDKMRNNSYDAVFSVNYNPMISDICESKGVPYYSWIYDSPIHIRDISSLKNSCNYAYFFDREQAEAYNKAGFEVYYMPLAGDCETFAESIKGKPHGAMDISFVGQLYHTEYDYYMSPLSDYDRGYMEAIIESQRRLYGGYIIPGMLGDEVMGRINAQYDKASKGKVSIEERELEYMLACEATSRDRVSVLMSLSEKGDRDVNVFSGETDERLQRIKIHPYVDYYDTMPGVFASSRINLNISLKCIRSGIPLRVFDILSCGGFLMTNYQSELYEYFTPGEELVVYGSTEEIPALCDYYLRHEDERLRIAKNGLERIKNDHSVKSRISKILGDR